MNEQPATKAEERDLLLKLAFLLRGMTWLKLAREMRDAAVRAGVPPDYLPPFRDFREPDGSKAKVPSDALRELLEKPVKAGYPSSRGWGPVNR